MREDGSEVRGQAQAAPPKRPRLGLKYGAAPTSGRPLPQVGGRH